MSALLIAVLVGVAIVLTMLSARGRRGDYRALEERHRAMVALGEIARHDRAGAQEPSERPARGIDPPSDLVGHGARPRVGRSIPVGVAVVTALVAAGGIVSLVRSGPHHHRSQPKAPATSIASPPAPPTTKVTPPSTAVLLISSDSRGARYQVLATADIELVPSSPCWLQVRTATAAGPILFEGVLHPGDRKRISASGPMWLRLGNPAGVAVTVNSTPLPLVGSTSGQPYNLEFQPSV